MAHRGHLYEIGVVTYPDGVAFVVAVFARSVPPHYEREINSASGRAAAIAIGGSRAVLPRVSTTGRDGQAARENAST